MSPSLLSGNLARHLSLLASIALSPCLLVGKEMLQRNQHKKISGQTEIPEETEVFYAFMDLLAKHFTSLCIYSSEKISSMLTVEPTGSPALYF